MAPPQRPTLRLRVWLVECAVIAVVVLAFMSVSSGEGDVSASRALAAVTIVGVVATAIVVGLLIRLAAHHRRFEAELTAWAGEQAVQRERLRIARDLHDLASHGLGQITVHAAAARTLTGEASAAEYLRALTDIEKVGREATTELRRMLRVLRSPGDDSAPLHPVETFADLPEIIEEARRGGVHPEFGDVLPDGVSAGTQLVVCAVVREGLANVARHAGPVRVVVTLCHQGGFVAVTVTDDGPAPGWEHHDGAGFGLEGLTERVNAVGGSLAAGAWNGGFRLSARLPDGSSS